MREFCVLLFFFNYFSEKFLSFIKKDIHSVSYKSILYAFISGKNMHKGLIFLLSL